MEFLLQYLSLKLLLKKIKQYMMRGNKYILDIIEIYQRY